MLGIKNFLQVIFGSLILVVITSGHVSASYDAEAEKFFGIINAYRATNNHAALTEDALLQNAANWMSEDMASNCVPKRSCTHTDSLGRTVYERLRAFGYPAGSTNDTLRGGEIIAWSISGHSTAEDAFGWWKNSSVHNENMLRDSYVAVGISRTCEGSYCAWVVNFGGKVLEAFTNSPAPILDPQNLPDGALIRAVGGIDVYIIKYMGAKKFKRLILSPSVFENYGHLKWSDVKNVDQSVLDGFLTSDLVRAVGDTKAYKLYASGDTGEKRWITTLEIFIQSGFDWDAVYQINSYDRDSYVTGANWQ
jgi:hypothetical protein